jgi:NAD(P)H-dependent FMN reductase
MSDPKLSAAAACHLLLISGSLRAGSTNAAVLATAQRVLPANVTAAVYGGLAQLPAFNPDDELRALPPSAAELRAALASSDAVLFSTPEYAGSLPGAFKNLLDWTVGDGLHRKPVGYVNASAHAGGAESAHQMLRTVLGYVNADLVEAACVRAPVRRDAIDAAGVITDAAAVSVIREGVEALVEHVRRGRGEGAP